MMCNDKFQPAFDTCLGWIHDTGVIKKMRLIAMDEYKSSKDVTPPQTINSFRPLSLMRSVMSPTVFETTSTEILIITYRVGRPIIRKVLKIRIKVVPLVCFGSR